MSKLIAIDIGHGSDTFERTGGKGLYVNGKKYEEHDFNSKVAVELDKLLRANGFETVMKQKPFSPEVYLTDRTNYYNAKGVDLVWSIHANANSNDEVEGRCAFYWNTSEDSKNLAELYVDECHKVDFETHGNGLHACKLGSWTNLHICRETNMTAVLTENGFMTNDEPGVDDDFELVFGSKQAEYVKDIARVHAKAIARFFDVNFEDEPSESKPVPKPSKSETSMVSTPEKGKRVESKYRGNEGLNFYSKPSWDSPVATFGYGMGWTIRKKLKVDGAYMFEVENSDGDVYYITAAEKFVKVVTEAKPEPSFKLPHETYYYRDYMDLPKFHGAGVKNVQEALASIYFYPNKGAKNNGIDGWYGVNSADAVKRFQSTHGLKADGDYGPKCRAKLVQALK